MPDRPVPAARPRARATVLAALAVGLTATLLPAPPATADVALLPRACAWPGITNADVANYAWPDTNATYFIRAARLDAGDRIVVRGTDPDARYWSLQTYRFGDSSRLDGVNDADVRRDADGSWSVTLRLDDDPTDPNVLQMPSPGPADVASLGNLGVLIYRVYVPASGGASGGAMPELTVIDADGTATPLTPCAPEEVGPPANRPVLTPATGLTPRFTRQTGSNAYPSADTAYLAAEAPYRAGKVLVVTGKAPRLNRHVRYWSVCQNLNADLLPVIDCAHDTEIRLRRDRTFAVAVVGPGQVAPARRRAFRAVTFLDWTTGAATAPLPPALLLYRTILPTAGFDRAAQDVPVGRVGRAVIGAYAPALRYVPLRTFLRDWPAQR